MIPNSFLSGYFPDQALQVLVVLALKTTLLLLAAWFGLALCRRSAAGLRHWLLTLALVGGLVLPLTSWLSPTWQLPVLPGTPAPARMNPFLKIDPKADRRKPAAVEKNQEVSLPVALKTASIPNFNIPFQKALAAALELPARPNPLPENQPVSPAFIVLLLWFAGVFVLLARVLCQTRRIARITRQSMPVGATWMQHIDTLARLLNIKQTVIVKFSADIHVPMTWGARQPVILLPLEAETWDESRRRVVLLHELAHIARRDYLTQWLALISCALNWFNPLVWKIARQAAVEREQAADDLVLRAGVQGTEYAGHLVAIAMKLVNQRSMQQIGLAMAQRSDLERRVRRILNTRHNRRSPRRTHGLIMAVVVLMLMSLGGMQLASVNAQVDAVTLTLAVDKGMNDGLSNTTLLADFEAAHPGVRVELAEGDIVPDAADGLDAHFEAMQHYAETADVLFFQGYNTSLTPFDTRAGYVLDLAPLINSDATFQRDDFYPQMISAFEWDSGVWALPVGADMLVIDYDKTAFDNAGVAYPDATWTLADFVNATRQLTQRDANGNTTRFGFANSGRIFREAFWRSLMESDAVHADVLHDEPAFDRPDIIAVLDAYHTLEQENSIGGDPGIAAMYVDTARKTPPNNHAWALLPAGKSVLLTSGFAVSAGTQHPELAYELVKFLSERPELGQGIPARRSLTDEQGMANSPDYQALMEQGFNENSLNYASLRFADYLNNAGGNAFDSDTSMQAILQTAELDASDDLATADSKKGTLTLRVAEPEQPVLAEGKIMLNFAMDDVRRDNQPLWDSVIQEFTASDAQVGQVNLQSVGASLATTAEDVDCFYLATNAVPSLSDGTLLALDPLLSADASFDRNDYAGNVLAAVQQGTHVYALPVIINPLVLHYDSARFAGAGVPEPANTWTVEEFATALEALKPSGQGQPPFVDNRSEGAYLLVLIAGYGGMPIDTRSGAPVIQFTDPAAVNAIRQVLNLVKDGDIRYSALGGLENSDMASPNNTTAIYPGLLNDFGRKIAPGTPPDKPVMFPTGHEYNSLAYDPGAGYISAQTSYPEACYRFISMLAQHPELFSAMPARRSLLADPAFTAAIAPDLLALYQQVDTLLADPNTVAFPVNSGPAVTLSDFLLYHWLFRAFDTYVLDDGDLEAALADSQQMAQAFQTCVVDLPPFSFESQQGDTGSLLRSYIDCAEQADDTLTPAFDALFGG